MCLGNWCLDRGKNGYSMRNIFSKKHITLPYYMVFILAAVSALVLVCVMFYLQFYNLTEIKYGLKTAGVTIFLLNFLPVFLFLLLFIFVSGRFSAAFAIVSFSLLLLTLANRVKTVYRNDPLMPTDFAMGAEIFSVTNNVQNDTLTKYLTLLGLSLVFGAALIIFLKNKRLGAVVRAAGTAAVIGVCCILYVFVYSNKRLYDRLPVTKQYYLVSHYNSKGFLYCFIYQVNDMGLLSRKVPQGYDKAKLINTIENDYKARSYAQASADGTAPHIFIIMGEAFADISGKSNLDFTNHRDPLLNFNRLKAEGFYGEVLVSHTGGGTADTEFEFLTGLSKREEDAAAYAFRLLAKPMESIASELCDIGYKGIFIHPGSDWFYNRRNVYGLLGFKGLYFDDYSGFAAAKTKGGYINEYDTISACIELFEENAAQNPGSPILEFCVTIQNHGPYPDKYPDWERNFGGNAGLTEAETNELSNYFLGVIDQDEDIGRLADYINGLGHPAVLLYFGDHMPAMPAGLLSKIGLDFDYEGGFETSMELFKTPYLIWQNDAARRNGAMPTGDGGAISSNFLGAAFLDVIGYGDISPLNRFLNELRQSGVRVTAKNEYVTQEGGYKTFDGLTEEQKAKILLYKQWQYYKLYDE